MTSVECLNEVSDLEAAHSENTTHTFLNMLQTLREIDGEFPLQYSICLAEIAMDEGMSLTALSKKAGLNLSTVSRIVGALSQYRQNGNPYGLVELKISPQERRRKELYLSDKGRSLMKDISRVLDAA
jgi:DNA-binding MarR family transcriptional regulator